MANDPIWGSEKKIVHTWLVSALDTSNCYKVARYARYLETEVERLRTVSEPVKKTRKTKGETNASDTE